MFSETNQRPKQKFLLARDLHNEHKGGNLLNLFKSSSSLSKSLNFSQKVESEKAESGNQDFGHSKKTLHKPSQSMSIKKSSLSTSANAIINLNNKFDKKLDKESTIVQNLRNL